MEQTTGRLLAELQRLEGRGLPVQPTVGGKQGGHSEARSPVNVMTTDTSACGRKQRVAPGNPCVRKVGRTSRMP